MSPQQESSEREWPAVWLADVNSAAEKFPDLADRLVLCKTEPEAAAATPTERYVPESSPQVLSKEDAAIIGDPLRNPKRRMELMDRLKDWADS